MAAVPGVYATHDVADCPLAVRFGDKHVFAWIALAGFRLWPIFHSIFWPLDFLVSGQVF